MGTALVLALWSAGTVPSVPPWFLTCGVKTVSERVDVRTTRRRLKSRARNVAGARSAPAS